MALRGIYKNPGIVDNPVFGFRSALDWDIRVCEAFIVQILCLAYFTCIEKETLLALSAECPCKIKSNHTNIYQPCQCQISCNLAWLIWESMRQTCEQCLTMFRMENTVSGGGKHCCWNWLLSLYNCPNKIDCWWRFWRHNNITLLQIFCSSFRSLSNICLTL